MEEEKLKQLKKLQTLQEEPNLAFFDELEDVCEKLEGIQGVLSDINSKETKTYETELKTLQEAILSLTESVTSKDTVVNIPLDQLSAQLVKVESAIKAIGVFKEMKIPEFPSELNLSEVQINELLLAIQSIPEFPIKELEKMINSLGDKLKQEKLEIPEFDYDRLEKKLNEVVKAVKNVSITVSSGNSGVQAGLIEKNIHTGQIELRTFQENHICSDNTTSTPLGANATFTGNWQDALNYSEIRISVITDQNSATNGLAIQWSDNGTDLIAGVDDNYTILANKGKSFSTPVNWRYFRVKYTNGAIAQGLFRLSSQVDRTTSKGSSHRITDSIVGDDDAILSKSVITGERDDGIFGNAILDNENRLEVSAQPYLYGIAEGAISGHSTLLKFGTRTSIAANTQSLIWEGTNPLYTYLTSAEQLKVSSSSSNDTVAGTGARTFKLIGLDGNFNEIEETVNLNGITAVTTTLSFIRVFRGFAVTSGTGGINAGNITVTNNAGTNQLMYIPTGDGQTLMTLWTVPAGKVAYITQITASNDSGKGARFSLFTRQLDGGIIYPWNIKYRAYLVGGNEVIPFNIPFKIPAKTDIEIRFTTPTAAGVTAGGATFELWFEEV